jgi:tetratricopeptide (TPR) repeat protein|tara:strand:+ start:4046 stop:4468 length:423 start_codon:yes stop_codon:yes gene_type:complete
MKIIIFKFTLIFFLLINFLYAKSEYFNEGVNLYENEKFKEAQFKFEQEIVFNPKSELSYLYLSKIFNKLDKIDLEEQNLNTVMLLNPKNEEAIYNLAKLKLASSDYKKSKELNNRLSSICNKFCNKNSELKIEIENLSKK